MESILKDKKLIAFEDFPNLQAQLEGAMNKLYVSAERFNENAKKLGRKDLNIELEGKKTPPKVQF
jgi:hypothetical protein